MTRSGLILGTCAALLSGGCSDPVGVLADPRASFRTELPRYEVRRTAIGWEAEIPFRYRNDTDQAHYGVNCRATPEIVMEKWVDGRWVGASGSAFLDCLSPPIVVRPGETYEATVRFFAAFPGNNTYPKLSVDRLEGVYRLLWENLLWSFDANAYPFGEELPKELRVSSPFELAEL